MDAVGYSVLYIKEKASRIEFFLIFLLYQTNYRILEVNILVWDGRFIPLILNLTSYPLQSVWHPLQNSSSTKHFWTLIGSSLSPYLNKSVQSLISAERTRGRKPFCNIRLQTSRVKGALVCVISDHITQCLSARVPSFSLLTAPLTLHHFYIK